METESREKGGSAGKVKLLYWIAAAAMAIAIGIELLRTANWLSVGSRAALLAALVLLATAKPAETRVKKRVIYALLAVSLGLLLAKVAGGGR